MGKINPSVDISKIIPQPALILVFFEGILMECESRGKNDTLEELNYSGNFDKSILLKENIKFTEKI